MYLRQALRINYFLTKFSRNLQARQLTSNQSIAYKYIKSSKLHILAWLPINSTVAIFLYKKFATKHSITVMAEESTIDSVLQNADQLFDQNHYQEALDVLDKYFDKSLPDIQWRQARAMYSYSKTIQSKEERDKMVRDSYNLIVDALKKDEKNFAIHKWMAIIMDANAELDGIRARLQQIETVKHHMNRAVELNPDDPTSWYLLGAFEFNMAELSWIQRKIVSTLFATPPNGDYAKALEYFQRAESKKSGFYSTNWLMMGKCYIALKDNESGKRYLEKAANCTVLSEDDRKCKQEAETLLKKM